MYFRDLGRIFDDLTKRRDVYSFGLACPLLLLEGISIAEVHIMTEAAAIAQLL